MAGDYDLGVGLPEDPEERQRYLDMLEQRGEIGHDSGLSAEEPPRVGAKTVGEAPVGSLNTAARIIPADAPPVAGRVAELGGAPHIEPNADAPPVQAGSGLSPARMRLKALVDQGAPPVTQYHGAKKFFDTLGKIFLPGVEQAVTGGAQKRYAANLAQAEGDVKAQDEVAPQPKPKEEQWTTVPGMLGPKGQLVQEEKNSGQIRYAPELEGIHSAKEAPTGTPAEQVFRQHMTGGPNGGPEINPATQKPYTVDEALEATQRAPKEDDKSKDIKDYLEANNLPDTAANREKARLEIAKRAPTAHVEVTPPKPDEGVLMNVPDGKGGHKLVRIKPGETIPEGSATPTQAASIDVKNEQGQKAGEDALRYAQDYIKTGAFSGPGDEALMEKFFELAKPSSGFRMTQAQIDMLKNAQGYMNGAQAKIHHAMYGTWFSDTLRQQIADTMTSLAKSRQAEPAPASGSGDGNDPAAKFGGHTVKKKP